MTTEAGVQTLQQWVAAYEVRGAAVFAGLPTGPVLAQCGHALPSDLVSYETISVVSWDTRVVLAMTSANAPIDPKILARIGAILPITKRAGAPFPERIGVGRARTADISLRIPSVSKYHAYFTQDQGGRWFLWDARSRNGTCVAGKRIEPMTGVELNPDALLSFGGEDCLFLSPDGLRGLIRTLCA